MGHAAARRVAGGRQGARRHGRRRPRAALIEPGAWLDAWSTQLADEGRVERAALLDARVRCAWLRLEPANVCDATCSSCAAHELRLDVAPFRAIAVANRTDLSDMPDRAADGGEGRVVFALTDGPGDDPASAALPMTVIFEYAQRGPAREWAARWHALAAASDADFPAALVALTERFVGAGDLAQVRTADALAGELVMHQFEASGGALVTTRVRNSPAWARVGEEDLRTWAAANAQAIHDGTSVLPRDWWADASSSRDVPPAWLADVDAHDDLVRGTCAGCHALAATGFQIDPRAHGRAKLSSFLTEAELARRTAWSQRALSGSPPDR